MARSDPPRAPLSDTQLTNAWAYVIWMAACLIAGMAAGVLFACWWLAPGGR